jgi:hypothetical protein
MRSEPTTANSTSMRREARPRKPSRSRRCSHGSTSRDRSSRLLSGCFLPVEKVVRDGLGNDVAHLERIAFRFALLALVAGSPSPTLRGQEIITEAGSHESVPASVLDALSLSGDLLLGYEGDVDPPGGVDRHRGKSRLRLGAAYAITDEIRVGARITTGSRDDPNSPYVTFGDGFRSLELTIDRLYLSWSPECLGALNITLGKFEHPFVASPIYGELVWDADVQPEGISIGRTWKDLGPFDGIGFAAGEYIFIEQGGADEALSTVAQLHARGTVVDDLELSMSLAYYYYSSATPDGSLSLLADNAGNVLVDRDGDGDPDDFLSDFSVLHPAASIVWTGLWIPITLSAEFIANEAARGSRGQGWAAGIAVGRNRHENDLRIEYQYQSIEQDAVFSPLAQDDFFFTTDFRGHLIGVAYRPWERVALRAWALLAERITSDEEDARLRFDVIVRF